MGEKIKFANPKFIESLKGLVETLKSGSGYNWYFMQDCIVGHLVKDAIGRELFSELLETLDQRGSTWTRIIFKLSRSSHLSLGEFALLKILKDWDIDHRDIYLLENLGFHPHTLDKRCKKDVIVYFDDLLKIHEESRMEYDNVISVCFNQSLKLKDNFIEAI